MHRRHFPQAPPVAASHSRFARPTCRVSRPRAAGGSRRRQCRCRDRRLWASATAPAASRGSQGVVAKPASGAPSPFILAPGVAVTLNYTEESAGNPVGGIRQGAAYTGQAFLGVDFDMQTLAGIDGGAVHTILTQRHGNNLAADYIGNNTSVQEVYGTQNFHLAQFTYEQKLFDNRVDFEIGRTVANISFLASPLYCSFQSNSICGNPTFIFKNSNFTYFPGIELGQPDPLRIDRQGFLPRRRLRGEPAGQTPR